MKRLFSLGVVVAGVVVLAILLRQWIVSKEQPMPNISLAVAKKPSRISDSPSTWHAKADNSVESSPANAATANVQVGDHIYRPTLNQARWFTRIYLAPRQSARVTVAFPKGHPGDPVGLEAADGGQFANGHRFLEVPLDDHHVASFEFQAGQNPGIYKVIVNDGQEEKTLDFWVGEPMPVAQR